MEATHKEIYDFLLQENVEETKLSSFSDWVKWFIDNNLYHIERDSQGKMIKVLFLRKLDAEDVENFPDFLHPEIPSVDKVTKFYLHKDDGKIFYCDLLVDKIEKDNDLKMENLNFAFEWTFSRFNFKVSDITDEHILLFYNKGKKTIFKLKDLEKLISKILNYQG